VAGLVPGAHEGKGLGNQFLNDLCFADALIHVVDVSGTTNEKGEETIGYDPINDIDWLRYEIHSWIYNNLKGRWGSIVRRHVATKSSPVETFQSQLSGYGANHALILRFCDKVTNTNTAHSVGGKSSSTRNARHLKSSTTSRWIRGTMQTCVRPSTCFWTCDFRLLSYDLSLYFFFLTYILISRPATRLTCQTRTKTSTRLSRNTTSPCLCFRAHSARYFCESSQRQAICATKRALTTWKRTKMR